MKENLAAAASRVLGETLTRFTAFFRPNQK